MLELEIQNRQVVITSLQVAETFGREHRNILAAIRDLRKDVEAIYATANFLAIDKPSVLFIDSTYESRGVSFPCIAMNRNGFLLLVARFTGKTALKIKLEIVYAFDAYEKKLRQMEFLKTRERDLITLGVNEGIAKVTAYEQISLDFGDDFRLPTYKESENLLTPTQISLILWKSRHPRLINRILQEMSFQEKIDGDWISIGEGIRYSERVPFNRHGHSELQLKWKTIVVDLIRQYLSEREIVEIERKMEEISLTVTDIGEILCIPASEINQILRRMKYQKRFRKIWIAIGEGLQYRDGQKWKTTVVANIRSFLQNREDV